jgi:hypothetical protein
MKFHINGHSEGAQRTKNLANQKTHKDPGKPLPRTKIGCPDVVVWMQAQSLRLVEEEPLSYYS